MQRYFIMNLDSLKETLEKYNQVKWITRYTVCDRYGFKGIASGAIDCLIQQGEIKTPVVECGEKTGPNTKGLRLCVREYVKEFGSLLPVWFHFESSEDGRAWVRLTDCVGEQLFGWSGSYYSKVIDDLWGIVVWHHKKFYPFLDDDEVLSEYSTMETLGDNPTINTANRAASRMLYRLARNLGWRKLTPREQKNHDSPIPWVKAERTLTSGEHTESGVGRYTLDSASGTKPME